MADLSPLVKLQPRLLNAPWWVLALVLGVPFGVATGIVTAVVHGYDLPLILYLGAASGVFFGLVMGAALAHQNRRVREATRFPPGQEHAVLRAATKGPVPTDPAVREAALRLATDQHARLVRWRIPRTVGFALFAVLEAVVAILGGPWLWPVAAAFVVLAVMQPITARRTERRIAVLRGATPAE